jgi:uncharacterized membrane protein
MAVYKETPHRSILKTISWRIVATLTTSIIILSLTKRWDFALLGGGIEAVAKLILYYLHERTWNCVNFGKKKHPLSSLPVTKALEEEDMEVIKNKLRDLGYINET